MAGHCSRDEQWRARIQKDECNTVAQQRGAAHPRHSRAQCRCRRVSRREEVPSVDTCPDVLACGDARKESGKRLHMKQSQDE